MLITMPRILGWKGEVARTRCNGHTLVELMIAVAVGLLLLAGLTTVFVQNSRTRDEVERANQQMDNGRYATQMLTDDIRNAGYLAELNAALLPVPATKPDPCATDIASLSAGLRVAVQGYDNPSTAPACLTDFRTGTDILVVRRASTCALGDSGCDVVVNGAPYFQASTCSSATELSATTPASYFGLSTDRTTLTLHAKDCSTLAPLHQYRTHIYFVANNDKAGDGIPTLKRAELSAGGISIVPLVEGIENMQIEYGIDAGIVAGSTATGTPGIYSANPDAYASCTAAVCMSYWTNIDAIKINILARNVTRTPGYNNAKSYHLGLDSAGSDNVVGPFNDAYRRHAYVSTARLNNVAGRNTQ